MTLRKHKRLLLFTTVLLALAGWRVVRSRRPRIISIPAVRPGASLTVLGSGFGADASDGHLVYRSTDGSTVAGEVQAWSDDKIIVSLRTVAAGGSVRVVRRTWLGERASAAVPFVMQVAGLPSRPYGYAVPVQERSPWPLFRHDHRNSGRSPLPGRYRGDHPWSFATRKGIFSTPIIDDEGIIYVGSADHGFYAVNPDGTQRWRFDTGEIIDSAGALPRSDPEMVIVPSGDGHLYALRTDADATDTERVLWTFDAKSAPRHDSYNNWFEGNVAVGFDGSLYAGNTNFDYYALRPDGRLKWTYETGANNWSDAAFGDDGTIYWGSNDTLIRAVRPDGVEKWRTRTWGFIAASAAVGSDGTVYIGSFDSYFYALDPATGAIRWTFKTNDHIYTSAALDTAADGHTTAIYFGSADGALYALDPAGSLRWKYDTGDPIRSSPAIGAAPTGSGSIVYFGSGNGKLYALDAADGHRRWSFDTTSHDPELRDRNDLNSSVALGTTGIYIGSEHGHLWYVPYDYCLRSTDERCQTAASDDLPADTAGLFYVTPGGSTEREPPAALSPATMITLRLLVRSNGQSVDARMCNTPFVCGADTLTIHVDPPFPFHAVKSADGRYLHIIPDDILEPGSAYRIAVAGDYYTGGWHIGNLTVGGTRSGRFGGDLTLHTAAVAPELPLHIQADEVSAFEWTRLALPIPPMLPSLNQIGFDYMDWIMGMVDATAPDANGSGKLILWGVGARRDAGGTLTADPDTAFLLPLSGAYRGDAITLSNRNFTMPVTGIPIPFNLYQLRGQFGRDLAVQPGATVYAETRVLSIPTFGPYLVLAGLANNVYEKLVVAGTYVTRPYAGPANHRPPGISVESVSYTAPTLRSTGRVVAKLQLAEGMTYPLTQHRPAILLIDAARTEAVGLNYHDNLTATADAQGNLAEITLTIPADTPLPVRLDAVTIVDAFPLHRQHVSGPAMP